MCDTGFCDDDYTREDAADDYAINLAEIRNDLETP